MDSNTSLGAGLPANTYSPDQEKIVRALADDKYYWRTRERMLAVTGMTPDQLDSALTQLLQQDIVQPAFSKNHNVIFGLSERVQRK